RESRGNWPVVRQFLEYTQRLDSDKGLMLLEVIAKKDRRDTPLRVLKDHFDYSANPLGYSDETYRDYILNPRIHNELLSAYKERFQAFFDPYFIQKCHEDVSYLAKWVSEYIQPNEKANPWEVPQLPVGVLELKVADRNSMNIFFLAAARSLGIASRMEPVRKRPQVLVSGDWVDVDPVNGIIGNSPRGEVEIHFEKDSPDDAQPVYFRDFTINRFQDGEYKTLDFSSSSIFEKFPATLELDEGSYSLVTVKRLPDGSSKTRRAFFYVKAGKVNRVSLLIPEQGAIKAFDEDIKLDLNRDFKKYGSEENINLDKLSGESGLVLIWMDPVREPTKHLVNDLIRLRSNFDNWEGNIALLLKPEKITPAFNTEKYTGLPERSVFVVDDTQWLGELENELGIVLEKEMPAVLVVDPNGKIVFQSSGYRIGIGDDVLN
ncbi:hypothetical protein, partial [Marinilabilia sp.]